ncbi:DUF4230 domain-containing protein [Niallia sp. NCCP-28]|uniref:DUF4230 domain-containing protein n=1 Tax=Niallia sp. NCCP-28 TaxID=2934712 RepID=UPI0020854585|nr:DUF4230 domain-containing protein [Niallia sp. NCCP-28]GKU83722.1 hypothetical protein NCCP28_31180 [Niallia sp. NCCP-28]
MVSRKQKRAINKEIDTIWQETASTAMDWKETKGFSFPFIYLKHNKKRRFKLIFFLAIVILVLLAIIIGIGRMSFSETAAIRKSGYLEQMKNLSSLASSQAFVKVILEKEDNEIFGKEIQADIPGTKRKILLVVPGVVTAGVNIEGLNEDKLEVDEQNKQITIILPHAELLQEPSIDFEKVETYSVSGIFRGEVNWKEGYALANEAKEEIKREAIEQGILANAEKNAKKTIEQFYEKLGYAVTVQFSQE